MISYVRNKLLKAKKSKTIYTDSAHDNFSYGYSAFFDPVKDIKEKENKKICDIGCGGGYWFNL